MLATNLQCPMGGSTLSFEFVLNERLANYIQQTNTHHSYPESSYQDSCFIISISHKGHILFPYFPEYLPPIPNNSCNCPALFLPYIPNLLMVLEKITGLYSLIMKINVLQAPQVTETLQDFFPSNVEFLSFFIITKYSYIKTNYSQ